MCFLIVTSLADCMVTLASCELLLITKHESTHFKEYFKDANGNCWCLVLMLK